MLKRLTFSRQILPGLAVIGIIVAALLIWNSQPERVLAAPDQTPPTAPAGGADTVAGSGVVEPLSELVEIGAFIPGVVDRVYVEPGQQVSQGQPLFSIDSRDARAALAEAQAQVASFRAQLAQAEANLATARNQAALYADVADPRAVSRAEVIDRQGAVRQAQAAIQVARAGIASAQASVAAAEVRLARHTVRAPRSGTILQVETRAGEYATAGPAPGNSSRPLMTMGDVSVLHVRIDIDESEIERVALNRPAVIKPRGGADLSATASFVRAEPLVVPKRSLTNSATERVDVRVLQVIYALPANAQGFFVGQQVDAFVPAQAGRARHSAPAQAAR